MSKLHNQLKRHFRSADESLRAAARMLEDSSTFEKMNSPQLRDMANQLSQAARELTRAEAIKTYQESQ